MKLVKIKLVDCINDDISFYIYGDQSIEQLRVLKRFSDSVRRYELIQLLCECSYDIDEIKKNGRSEEENEKKENAIIDSYAQKIEYLFVDSLLKNEI